MAKAEKERRPFRFLVKFLAIAGILYLAGRLLVNKKDEYYGITESEARAKFESKLGPRIGEDKAAEVADQVIPKLKEKGVIKPDPVEEMVDKAKDTAKDVGEAAGEAADTVVDVTEEALEKIKD